MFTSLFLLQSNPVLAVQCHFCFFYSLFAVVRFHLQFLFTSVINKSLLLFLFYFDSPCQAAVLSGFYLPCPSPVSHLGRCFCTFEILKESAFILKTGSEVTHIMHIYAKLVKQRKSLTPFPTRQLLVVCKLEINGCRLA